MKAVDTTFIIDLLRGDMGAVEKSEEFDEAGGAATTAVNLFEITYGIYRSRHIDREHRLSEVERLFSRRARSRDMRGDGLAWLART